MEFKAITDVGNFLYIFYFMIILKTVSNGTLGNNSREPNLDAPVSGWVGED